MVAVNTDRNGIAGGEVPLNRDPHHIALRLPPDRGALQAPQVLLHLESELRIKCQRSTVTASLHEPNPRRLFRLGARERSTHQPLTDALVLHRWIHRDRSQAPDRAALEIVSVCDCRECLLADAPTLGRIARLCLAYCDVHCIITRVR